MSWLLRAFALFLLLFLILTARLCLAAPCRDVCTEAYVVPIMRSLLAVLIPHLHGVWLGSADQEDRLGPVIGELTRILRSAWSAFSECRKKSGELVTTTLALLFPIDLCSGRASCVALHTSTGVLRSYFDSFRALGEQQRPLLMQVCGLNVLEGCAALALLEEGALL